VKPLEQALNDYVSVRRSLGFRFQTPAIVLRSFVVFLQAEGASHITRELALRWALQPAKAQPSTWTARLGMVRRFAIWCSATEPLTEIPPADLLLHPYRRRPPHIFSDEQIERLLRKTQQLPSPKGLRAHTFATLFGLLMVTGTRVSEALGLEKPDIDLDHGILHIRCGKFGKSRYVPIHPSTVEALKKYANARDHLFPSPLTLAFFLSERGTRITNRMAEYTFAKLSQQIGLRLTAKHHGRGPRLQDMQHRFAVRTLIDWYRAGLDAERELPKLATYLGHVHVKNTYWYLEAVPELMQLTIDRLIQQETQP
jgi:integrase/recombinase XerD